LLETTFYEANKVDNSKLVCLKSYYLGMKFRLISRLVVSLALLSNKIAVTPSGPSGGVDRDRSPPRLLSEAVETFFYESSLRSSSQSDVLLILNFSKFVANASVL